MLNIQHTVLCNKSWILHQGSGADYSGPASRTKTGAQCTKWDSPEVGEWFTEEQLAKLGPLEGNNKCRNPDDESEPWCLVGEGLGDYDICDVFVTVTLEVTSSKISTTSSRPCVCVFRFVGLPPFNFAWEDKKSNSNSFCHNFPIFLKRLLQKRIGK